MCYLNAFFHDTFITHTIVSVMAALQVLADLWSDDV
jgi:hypothetical protein